MENVSAIKLLEDCEKGLRRLVSAAAAAGDYGSIIKLTSWARVLGGLVEDAGLERGPSVDERSDAKPTHRQPKRVSTSKSSKGSQRTRMASGYPRFFRNTRDIVKIGWSKRERTEYQHKAPQSVLMQLVSKIAVVGAGGAIFTAEDLFPLGADSGSPVPNYQGYLCLAWLRHEGLVHAHGRQGYTVVNGENLSSAVTSHWNDLLPNPGRY